jgi:hypothetical protein
MGIPVNIRINPIAASLGRAAIVLMNNPAEIIITMAGTTGYPHTL